MKTISISVKKRTDVGKKSTKKLRKNDDVPCVMYGGAEVLHFYAQKNDFRHLVFTPSVYIVELDIEGEKHKAIMQDLQFNPTTDEVQHIDFVEVFDNKPVTINIPVELTGAAIGIKQGGKPRLRRRTLKVRGPIASLPDKLDIDITNVNIGDVVKIGDLSYDGLEVLDPPRAMVYSIVSSRLAMRGTALPEDEEGAAEEGAEEGAAEGAGEGEGESEE